MWEAFWHHGSMVARAYAPFAEALSKYWASRAPFALYVTEKTLQNRYPCGGVTAGISDVMIPDPDQKVLDRRMNRIMRRHRPLTFGFAGSIENESKGVREALCALKEAQSALPPYEFRIIGPGESGRWKELAKDLDLRSNVRFSGLLPAGEAVLKWMDTIDIYLHPSFREGLPRSVIEAMSRGSPVLASRAGGIPELLPDGVLHRAGHWRELAQHIRTYATDQEWHLQNARRNFGVSRKYRCSKLKEERREFWGKFYSYANADKTGGGVVFS
jgi:glycosyltransferase involved in cell wall biosynthesis